MRSTPAPTSGMFKAQGARVDRALHGIYQVIISDGWMRLLQFKILRMDQWAGMEEPWTLHERIDTYYYNMAGKNEYIPPILGTDIRQLGLRLTLDAAMLGVGGLMGIVVATSCMLGALINFVILAPIMIQHGDIAPRVAPNGIVVHLARGDRESVVAMVGRHDDGRGLAGEPPWSPADFQGPFKRSEKGEDRYPQAHRIPPVDFRCRHADIQRPRGDRLARVFRRALAAGIHFAAADFRVSRHLHQLHGTHFVDTHRGVVQDNAVLDGSDRPHQSSEQSDSGGYDW